MCIRDRFKGYYWFLFYIKINERVTETLRLYSALATLDRVCVKSYRIPGTDVTIEKGCKAVSYTHLDVYKRQIPGTDVTIEKGCKVVIPHYAIQHDTKYYPDPLAYDPDRFLQDNVKSRPSYTYMPFGEGPRMCIGKKILMTTESTH